MSIDLPRALDAYFAFAELPPAQPGRRFTITFTYMEGGRLDRLQWWWQASPAQERGGEHALQGLRQEAIERFRQHIERWLANSRRCLKGGDPFPQLEPLAVRSGVEEPGYVEAERAYARMTAGR
jgi:hypothetical protein